MSQLEELSLIVEDGLKYANLRLHKWLVENHADPKRHIAVPYMHPHLSSKRIYVLMPKIRPLNGIYPSLEEAKEKYPYLEVDWSPLDGTSADMIRRFI